MQNSACRLTQVAGLKGWTRPKDTCVYLSRWADLINHHHADASTCDLIAQVRWYGLASSILPVEGLAPCMHGQPSLLLMQFGR